MKDTFSTIALGILFSIPALILVAASVQNIEQAPVSVPREEVVENAIQAKGLDAPKADESTSDSTADEQDAVSTSAVSYSVQSAAATLEKAVPECKVPPAQAPGASSEPPAQHPPAPAPSPANYQVILNSSPTFPRASLMPSYGRASFCGPGGCLPSNRAYAVPTHYFRAGAGQGCAVCGKSIYDTVHPWRNVSAHATAPSYQYRTYRGVRRFFGR